LENAGQQSRQDRLGIAANQCGRGGTLGQEARDGELVSAGEAMDTTIAGKNVGNSGNRPGRACLRRPAPI
jgi:hypothetical protein